MKINNLTKEEVFKNLVTSENGLTEEEAKRRLSEFGLKEIKEIKKTPLSIKILKTIYPLPRHTPLDRGRTRPLIRVPSSR